MNTYSALERWRELDPDGSDERKYNRYAHISVIPTTGSSGFERGEWDSPDTLTVRLSLPDMARLGIRYYVSLSPELPEASGGAGGLSR